MIQVQTSNHHPFQPVCASTWFRRKKSFEIPQKKSFNTLKKNKKRRKYSIIWIWMQQETLNPSSFGSSVNEFKLAGYCVIKVSYRYAVICLTKSTVRFSKPKWEKRLFLYKKFKREFLKILNLLSTSSVLV